MAFRKKTILLILVSAVGFLDATYLGAKYYLGGPIPCSFVNGCDIVTKSEYATVMGIPVAVLGALYYLSMLILGCVYLETKKISILKFIARYTLVGFLVSLYLIIIQIFILKAICLYCMLSAMSSIIIFTFGLSILLAIRQGETKQKEQQVV